MICLQLCSFLSWKDFKENLNSISTWGLLIVTALVVLVVVLLLVAKKRHFRWDVRQLTLGACLVSLSYLLSFLTFYQLPFGGSITVVSMLPLLAYGFMYGPIWGTMAGFVYFLLQCTQSLYYLSPLQFAFDYIIPFTILGTLPGVFRTKHQNFNLYAGFALAVLARYAAHVFAGVVFWGSYAEGYGYDSPFVYSVVYNSFVLVDALPCFIIVSIPQIKKLLFARRGLKPRKRVD